MSDSITLAIAQYAASTSPKLIPAKVKERAKKVIFDEMASACFGRRSLGGTLAARYAASFRGQSESTILGTKLHTSAPYAALANGAAGHGEEIDGAHPIGGHPGATIVHAALATAELQRTSGDEFLNAVILGYDVGVRAMEACGGIFVPKTRFHLHADFLYALGASVAASRILGLNPERHCHALALATFQINGLYAMYAEQRHISTSFCYGQYSFAGVSAALMSSFGLEGNEDIIGTEHGVLDAWGIQDGKEIVTRNLGQDYAVMDTNFKFMNAGYPTQAGIEAAMTLINKHGIDIDAITSVRVGMPENALRVVDNRKMHNICIQDMVSAALVLGGLRLDEAPFPAVLTNPAFPRLRSLVTLEVDSELDRNQPDGRGANVTISTADGSTFSHCVDHPKGHSLRGEVTWSDLSEKWTGMLVGCDVERALALARRLDDLEDVGQLLNGFSGARSFA